MVYSLRAVRASVDRVFGCKIGQDFYNLVRYQCEDGDATQILEKFGKVLRGIL